MMIKLIKNINETNHVANGHITMAAQQANVQNNEKPARLNILVGQVKPALLSQFNANQT
jgi:hypothetical protein